MFENDVYTSTLRYLHIHIFVAYINTECTQHTCSMLVKILQYMFGFIAMVVI